MADTLHAYEHVSGIYFPIASAVFVLVVGTLAVLLIRGSRRTHPATGPASAPRFEAAYALLLGAVVVVLLWVTFTAETPLDRTAAHPALRVKVTAGQWSWRFRYPNGVEVAAVATWHPARALVPVGTEIEFAGSSEDVIHGFWVPRLHFQRQLLPGYTTHFDLRFDRAGLYGGTCSVFCGDEHSEMHFALEAVSPASFQAWLVREAARRKGAAA
jgi:cytochrome c oxidase subunit II